jgi:hypothetical protein
MCHNATPKYIAIKYGPDILILDTIVSRVPEVTDYGMRYPAPPSGIGAGVPRHSFRRWLHDMPQHGI